MESNAMRAFLGTALAAISLASEARTPTSTTVISLPPVVYYGYEYLFAGEVTYAGAPCPPGLPPPMEGRMRLQVDGRLTSAAEFFSAAFRDCSDGIYSERAPFYLREPLRFGTHEFSVEYSGSLALAPSAAPIVSTTVLPHFQGALEGGKVALGGFAPIWNRIGERFLCTSRMGEFSAVPSGESPPSGHRFPLGFVNFKLEGCVSVCGACVTSPPKPPMRTEQGLLLEFPEPLPANATVWARIPTLDHPVPPWQPLEARIMGRYVSVVLAGGWVNVPLSAWDPDIIGSLAIAIPEPEAAVPAVAGHWWGGPDESGWGVEITPVVDGVSALLYVYDESGRPTWFEARLAAWDGVRHRFEGEIFGPSGAPFHASDAAKLRYGEAVGRVTLAFGADGTGTLSFDIGGIRGSKTLLAMAAAPEGLLPRAGAWAGDVSNPGWGLRITDNGDSLFVLWHTFDSDGRAAWFVMPAATLRDDGRITGTLFRTSSSPWLGAPYDASQLSASPVGEMSLAFAEPGRGTMSFTVEGLSGNHAIFRHGR